MGNIIPQNHSLLHENILTVQMDARTSGDNITVYPVDTAKTNFFPLMVNFLKEHAQILKTHSFSRST